MVPLNINRRRCASLVLTGAFLAAGLLGLPTAPVNGSIAPSQTLQVVPPTVKAGSPATLTLTYGTVGSEVKGTITLTVPPGWDGTPAVSTAECAAAGCVIGQPQVSGNTVTMPGSVLPPGQEFQISYGDAVPPDSAGPYSFTVTGNGNPVSASVTVVCGDGLGTMSVSPSAADAATTNAFTFTYTASGCGLLAGSKVSLEVPAGWPLPSPGGVNVSSGTVTVSGREITVSGATLPSGGDLALRYATTVPAAPAGPGTATFPAFEQTAAGGTLTPLVASPEISVLSTGNGDQTGGGTHSRPPRHGRPKPQRTTQKISRPRRHPAQGRGDWPLIVLLAAVLLAAAIVGAAGALRRFDGRGRLRPNSGVGAVPHLGPAYPAVIRTTPGKPALVVRVEPHAGALLHHTRQVTP